MIALLLADIGGYKGDWTFELKTLAQVGVYSPGVLLPPFPYWTI